MNILFLSQSFSKRMEAEPGFISVDYLPSQVGAAALHDPAPEQRAEVAPRSLYSVTHVNVTPVP